MYTFIHAADLHIDSPLRGLERYDGAPVDELRGATRKAFDNLVRMAIEEPAAFVVISGDVFDQDWRDYNTGLYFNSRMVELQKHGIPVYLISGNHDAASQISRSLKLPDNVRRFSVKHPETERIDDLGVAIHGHGFATPAVTEDLSGAYPPPIPGLVNIGLLHTSAGGREGHENYAPCTVAGLKARGYDYWALGHVHRYEVLSQDPWIVFSGNTQGRHARELGEKGCSVVTVDEGRITEARFAPLDVLRWTNVSVSLADVVEPEEAVERVALEIQSAAAVAPDRLLAVRVTLAGRGPARGALLADFEQWTNQIRARAGEASGGRAWVEKVVAGTEGMDAGPVPSTESLRDLLAAVRAMAEDAEQTAALPGLFKELKAKLPLEVCQGDGALLLGDPEYLAQRMADVEQILVARLGGSEVAR